MSGVRIYVLSQGIIVGEAFRLGVSLCLDTGYIICLNVFVPISGWVTIPEKLDFLPGQGGVGHFY